MAFSKYIQALFLSHFGMIKFCKFFNFKNSDALKKFKEEQKLADHFLSVNN